MAAVGLVRTQYWNLSGPNPTPRTGNTFRAESRTDLEGFVLAADAARNAALQGWGVAAGFEVSAVAGAAGLTVAVGVGLDRDGHVLVLGEDGVAVVDPSVGAGGVQNIPTVPVTAAGVVLDTTGLSGDRLLTVTWREVEKTVTGLLVLRQAPWLRLVDPATFVEDGLQLVLAAVRLGAGGVVDGLEPGSRRLAGVAAGRVELSVSRLDSAGLGVGQEVAGRLESGADGGLELSVVSSTGVAGRALSIDRGSGDIHLDNGLHVAAATRLTGDVQLEAGVRVAGPTRLAAELTVSGRAEVTGDLSTTGMLTAGGDLAVAGDAVLDAGLQVAGDFSAASAALTALTVSGNVIVQGTTDDGGALDVSRRMRVRSGGSSAGIWFHQDRDRGFVGMVNNTHIGFWGSGTGWDLTMDTENGRVGVKTTAPTFDLHVNGTMCATSFCNPSDVRLKTGVADVVDVLDRLAGVRAVTFVRTGVEQGTERRQAGVLAQDVVHAFPELVVPMGPDGLMAVDYAGLTGVLVGAVNELRAANAALASRVASLDKRENDNDRRG